MKEKFVQTLEDLIQLHAPSTILWEGQEIDILPFWIIQFREEPVLSYNLNLQNGIMDITFVNVARPVQDDPEGFGFQVGMAVNFLLGFRSSTLDEYWTYVRRGLETENEFREQIKEMLFEQYLPRPKDFDACLNDKHVQAVINTVCDLIPEYHKVVEEETRKAFRASYRKAYKNKSFKVRSYN